MMLSLKRLRDALTSINGLDVYHYWRPRLQAPFLVWAEDGEDSALHTSNHKAEQGISGTIDYYTKTEYDTMVETIQEKLNTVENLGWRLNSVQFEDETNLIHYEWTFSIA